jgi:hypothetical protein
MTRWQSYRFHAERRLPPFRRISYACPLGFGEPFQGGVALLMEKYSEARRSTQRVPAASMRSTVRRRDLVREQRDSFDNGILIQKWKLRCSKCCLGALQSKEKTCVYEGSGGFEQNGRS